MVPLASMLAGEGTGMQRDYASHSTRHYADLDSAEEIGRLAGERAVKRLNPANPDQRRDGFDFRQRVWNSRIDPGPQNQRLAATGARDTGGDSKLEV